MAKQVLDLYTLYKLVTEKGGLVEVINKKIWREITKGLNLPTSITSAAFTLRTQYMKYLYPYECEKRGLSSPGELQAAIDSNRREGRRQSYGSAIFNYSPVGSPSILTSPKMSMSHLAMSTYNGVHLTQGHSVKKEDDLMSGGLPGRVGEMPMSLRGHHGTAAAQAAAGQAAAALEQPREKPESGEPPEKKRMDQQRLMQHALQRNLLAVATQLPVNIKFNNRGERMRGVLFAKKPSLPMMLSGHQNHTSSQGKTSLGLNYSCVQIQPSCCSSSSSSSSTSSTSSVHGPGNSSP
eukprot:XP_014028209.1 PREDICTED: AT-rich interactive domain-containing protein 3A-like isoform X2 [Salmo salar]